MLPATVTIEDQPAKPPTRAAKPPKVLRITAKVREAVHAMVWLGLKRDEAAQHAGIKDNSLYVAFRRPDVKAFYLAECEMLRLNGKARRIHRLNDMVEQNDNKAAVINAALALEGMGSDNPSSSLNNQRSPGVVIQIVGSATISSEPSAGRIPHADHTTQVIDNVEE